ncbi:MAG: M81 family metallopeptidase [Gammaproteobacteria bacterium]|nr:MAG: M81 family metallopeptidase [Gammaproteobacteria bacterium]
MARIAIAGWHHETNTFAPVKADFAAFEQADGWPGLSRGQEMFDAVEGVHLPITGAIETLDRHGHQLVPLLWCSATPSAHVTEEAFERISEMLLIDLERALPVDGVYLDLHGAMVCEHLQDGEGEFLRRLRALVGDDLPVAVSLDLHANLTEAMVRHASVLDAYRTYPHVDMGETGARAAGHLHRLLETGERWAAALRRTPFVIPLNWGCTLVDPAKSLYARLPDLIAEPVTALSLACGFPLADIAEMGPGMVAYGRDQDAADRAVDALLELVNDNEAAFAGRIWEAHEAVAEALARAGSASGPVILADTQDNPGGGGTGDTTGLLRALVEGGATGAVLGLLVDPDAATAAHAAGVGAQLSLQLGGKSAAADQAPYAGRYKVLALGDGCFTATGPMWLGSRMRLGPMALLEVGGVRVAVASKAMQAADQAMFRHLDVEPAGQSIMALKSSVHFRNDFQAIADSILVTAAPGPVYADPSRLDFRNLRAGLRLTPRGKSG